MVEEIHDFDDWNIGEETFWGVPIPYFINKSTKEAFTSPSITDHFISLVKDHGTDVWYKYDVVDLLPEEYKLETDKYIKGHETFSPWFDSSISFVNHQPSSSPRP